MNTQDDPNKTDEQKCDVPENKKDSVGLRDDILLFLFLVPVVGVFLPWTRDSIKEGLMILNEIPDWFSFIIVLAVISIIGLRKQLAEIITNFSNFRKK